MLSAAPRQTGPRRSTMPFRRQNRQVYALTAARLSFMAQDRPAKRDEKLAVGSCRLHSPTGDKIDGVTRSLRRFFDPVGRGVPAAKLHEKPVTPAVLPPVALAGRRQDRRCYPVVRPVFRPCQLGADRPAKRDEKPAVGSAGDLGAGCTGRPATAEAGSDRNENGRDSRG